METWKLLRWNKFSLFERSEQIFEDQSAETSLGLNSLRWKSKSHEFSMRIKLICRGNSIKSLVKQMKV